MIKKDFIINFANKKISYNKKGSKTMYDARELYSFLQDLLDNPDNMQYGPPIIAKSPTKFKLINGWKMEKRALKHLIKGTISQ